MPTAILKNHPVKITLFILLALLVTALFCVPWQSTLEQQIKAALAKNGFKDASLHVTAFDSSAFTAADIALGQPAPLTIKTLRLDLGAPYLTLSMTGLSYAISGNTLEAERASVEGSGNLLTKTGGGQWHISGIHIKAGETALPVLVGEGPLTLDSNHLTAEGEFKSADGNVRASFNLNLSFRAPEKSQLKLITATMPWNKGRLSTRNVVILLNDKKDITLELLVEHVPVGALMQMLTGAETPATGVVSGTIPLTIKADGSLDFGASRLETKGPGIITLKPETIPGDNEQIMLVRDIMKNLHYTVLSIALQPGTQINQKTGVKKRALAVLLTLEGNNPDVAGGRPVKLNVQLNGDVLNLIQQSLLSLVDPSLFLKQENLKQR